MNNLLKKALSETDESYKRRLLKARQDLGFTYQEISSIINEELGTNYSADKYRKEFNSKWRDEMRLNSESTESANDNTVDQVDTVTRGWIEAVKSSDIKTQTSAYVRAISREETLLDIARELTEHMNLNKRLDVCMNSYDFNTDREAILCISDWHYGIEIDSYWNTYNPDIFRQRLSTLLVRASEKCIKNQVSCIHVVNLGDLISGIIHLSLRLQNRIDVISQALEVSEILCEFLAELAQIAPVHYYDCYDNHSRIEPNKKNSLDLESFTRIIHHIVSKRKFESAHEVVVNENLFSRDIVTFNVLGHNIAGVHGHKDTPEKIIEKLTLAVGETFGLILTAHQHHFYADERYSTVLLGNGSLMGTDDYAQNLRLHSYPSQNLVIVTPDNCIDEIHRITFK